MPRSLPESATKQLVIVSAALAVPLHLFVDPAATVGLRVVAAVAFAAGVAGARVRRSATLNTITAGAALVPVLLARAVHVEALNVFSTVTLAALLGALLPGLPRDRWAIPQQWRALLAIWASTIALAWPVMILREAGLRLGTLRDAGTLASWAMLSTPQVESWILYTAITQLAGALWLDASYASREEDEPLPGLHGLWIGATLASLVAIYQGTIDIAFLSGGPWPALRRAPGTLLDANAYGVIAALGGPLAFVSIPYLRIPHKRRAQAAALAVNWAGAWMSGSRTGLICGLFGALLLVYYSLRTEQRDTTRQRVPSSLLAAAGVFVLVLIVAASAVGPGRRVLEAEGASSIHDLWSRGGYGTVADRVIRDYPLTGVGIGTFNWLAPDYWRMMAHDRLPPDNAQNWWRQQVAEFGVVASLPVVAWSLMLAWLVFTRHAAPDTQIEAEVLRGLIIGVGVASAVGMPTQNPLVLLMFFAIVARFDLLTRPAQAASRRIPSTPRLRSGHAESRVPALVWVTGLLIAVGYAAAHLALARGSLKPLARAERTNRDYITGTYPSEPLPAGRFRWTRKHATYALNVPTRYLSIRFHVEHPDIATHPVKVRVTTPCETLVDEFRTNSDVDGRSVEIPEGQSRVTFDVDVSRTWKPSDRGGSDHRDLGSAVEMDFVGRPGVVASEQNWIRLKPCPD